MPNTVELRKGGGVGGTVTVARLTREVFFLGGSLTAGHSSRSLPLEWGLANCFFEVVSEAQARCNFM